MTTHLLIDANNTVVNSVVWDGVSDWQPPAGLRAVAYTGMWRDGWKWDGTQAVDPNPPPPVPPAPTARGIKTV